VTEVRAAHDGEALYVRFDVEDRYVLCLRTEYNSDVCRDACVEFFTQPKPEKGYLNFEVNCVGTLHLGYHELPGPGSQAPAKRVAVDPSIGRKVRIETTERQLIRQEITGPREWKVAMRIPLEVLEEFVGSLRPLADSTWMANFYKCGSDCSHPHWASWNPIGEALNFHRPEYFAPIRFGR
jgi:hypothetical protein